MLHVLLADLPVADDRPVSGWPLADWRKTKDGVRIVYDGDERALRPVLRDLCAHDVWPVELLDIDRHALGTLHYDRAAHRRANRICGLPDRAPWVHWLTRNLALWLIGELTQSNEALACKS